MDHLLISQTRRNLVFFMKPSEINKAIKNLWKEMQETMERGTDEWEIAMSDLKYMQGQLEEAIYG